MGLGTVIKYYFQLAIDDVLIFGINCNYLRWQKSR